MISTTPLGAKIRDLPIRRKLRLIFTTTTVIALTFAGLGMLAADTFLSYRYLQDDLGTFAQIIANNSTAALAFNDPEVGSETLGALKARSHVQIACVRNLQGQILATYSRPNFTGACPAPSPENVRSARDILIASEPILLAGRPIGTLVLQYDLGEIVQRVTLFGAIVLVGLLASYIITVALSSGLQALIAQPLLALAGVAHAVTRSNDYKIRAAKTSEDELGLLADAINQMMETVQHREQELRKSLTQQKAALDQLATLNTELQRSNTDLERFAFMASHDLQEPLRMITMYSQLLVTRRDTADQRQLEQFATFIAGGTARMRELLADLLAYSELASSTDRPTEIVDTGSVIQSALEMMRVRLDEINAHVTVASMPLLHAHRNRITSLFQNLLENAVKYRSATPLQVQITVERHERELLFAVADNGIGISEEYFTKIFVAFQRLHGKEIPGTGIGLAICKRVVERYGGRIWVESTPGEGSTFRFILPISMCVTKERANEQHT